MTTSVFKLSDLPATGYADRLSRLVRADTRLTIDCSGVERLPIAFLAAAIAAARERHALICLEGLGADARRAVEIIDDARVLALEAPPRAPSPLLERPFAVVITGDGLLLQLHRGLPRLAQMADASEHGWVQGVAFATLSVDLAAIDNLNSLLVAWLIQLSHAAAPLRIALSNLSAQAATQLRQLRLNHLMDAI